MTNPPCPECGKTHWWGFCQKKVKQGIPIMPQNTNPPLPEEIQEQIFIDAENLYNLLDEKARDKDHYDFGLPMFEKVKEPIEELLTVYAQRTLVLKDALERIANIPDTKGRKDCAWGDTGHKSESVAYGYNLMLEDARSIAREALSKFPEQGEKGGVND